MRIEAGALVAGRYEVERTLGQGGMGAVYVALDRKFGARVALKVAAASGAAYDEFKARFAREARIGHQLGRRRGVVRALDWGELDDGVRLYVVMDLVEGARALRLTTGSRDERLRRLLRAAEIVAEAHRQGVVHRDLKPANLLEDVEGEVHLADFGLAKLDDEPVDEQGSALTAPVTKSGLAFGTPLFMAPEQFDDAKRADARADVYTLGVMLHLALTGEYPYPGAEPMSVAIKQRKVLEGMAPAPTPRSHDPEVPGALERLCTRAMAVRPEERPPSAEAFAAGLRDALAASAPATLTGMDTLGPRTATLPSADPAPPPRRARRIALALGGLALAWVVLVVVAQFTGAPAVFVLRLLPVARLVDFTPPDVVLGHWVRHGELWTATPDMLVSVSVLDVSPGTVQVVCDRTISPPVSLRPEFLQSLELPVALPGPGRRVVSLWVQDRAGNETDLAFPVTYHPVDVELTVVERSADKAVIDGRVTPPPPSPYTIELGREQRQSGEGPTFRVEVPLAPGQTEVNLAVKPPIGGAVWSRVKLP